MKCSYCGAEAHRERVYCIICGTKLEQEKEAIPEPVPVAVGQNAPCEFLEPVPVAVGQSTLWECPEPMSQEEETAAEQAFPVITAAPVRQEVMRPEEPSREVAAKPAGFSGGSALQLPVGRSLLKMVLLGLITAGIYPTVIWSRIVTELNIAASRYDGKRTMPYFGMMMLAPVTLSVYVFVWFHRFCNRVGAQLELRNCDYRFGAKDFWLWCMLGSLILVGPFIFVHKLMKSMNLINAHYNTNG